MRPILLIMWTAFQSFTLRDNNSDNNNNNSTCNNKITLTIKFIYAGFCCIFKKRLLKDVFSDKSKKNCVTS